MNKYLMTATAAVAVLSAGLVASFGAPAVTTHHARANRHVIHQSTDITSFSSSARVASTPVLNVGINHPAKK